MQEQEENRPPIPTAASRNRQEIPERREAAVFLRSFEIRSFFLLTNRKIPPKTPLALRALQVSQDLKRCLTASADLSSSDRVQPYLSSLSVLRVVPESSDENGFLRDELTVHIGREGSKSPLREHRAAISLARMLARSDC